MTISSVSHKTLIGKNGNTNKSVSCHRRLLLGDCDSLCASCFLLPHCSLVIKVSRHDCEASLCCFDASWNVQQLQMCRRHVKRWCDRAAGLPPTPSSHHHLHGHDTCWTNIKFRHVVQITLAVANILATVSIYIDINGLLLVIIYITFIIASFVEVLSTNPSYVFLPEGCEGIVHGIGFLLESLFFWCLQHDSNKDNNYQYIILIIVTLTCTVLSWVNVTCHTCQQFDTSLVTRYCLCMAMYLQSSWISHCGINFLFQVRLPSKCKQNLYSVLYVKCFHICRQMVLV